jgi:hypothetical protein
LAWSTGVEEYWSVEKKDPNPLAITPKLQYSITPIPIIKGHPQILPVDALLILIEDFFKLR